MKKRHGYILAALWLIAVKPLFAEIGSDRPPVSVADPPGDVAVAARQKPVQLAQNGQSPPSDLSAAERTGKAVKSADKPEASKQTEPQKMKPFVPSETVPADQGVDFPYDI